MNSEQFRLLGIESDYFAADGSYVRVPDEVLASLAAILTAPGQPFVADFDEVFNIAPEDGGAITGRRGVVALRRRLFAR